MTTRAVEPLTTPPDVTLTLPGSKSITNRALLVAGCATGTSELEGVPFSDDIEAMIGVIEAFGAGVEVDHRRARVTIEGNGGRLPTTPTALDARMSGTTSRFAVSVAATGSAPITLDGHSQLRDRPFHDVIDALRAAGVVVDDSTAPGFLPLTVTGPIGADDVAIAGHVSSQFLSGLLIAAPLVEGGLRLTVTTELISRPYLDLTTSVMAAFGAPVEMPDPTRWVVTGGGYRATDYAIEPDASTASYFMAAAAMTGGRVRISGLGSRSLQGDVGFAEVLASMGADVDVEDHAIEVRGTGTLHGVAVDMRHISDTVPTLAAVAAVAQGPTTISGVGFIRGKESDRIAAPVTELNKLGVHAEIADDGFVVIPDGRIRPGVVATYEDHRMAMAFALLGLVAPGIEIDDPGCVAKTFPDFFDVLDQLR